jgi:paired amphipathic helix protein Sin3a
MLYSRLKTFKDIANGLSGDAAGYQPVNPLAKELGLTDPAAAILEEGPNPAAHFYHHLLDQCEKLFDGEIDTPTFEETVRFMYGIKAYPAFTLDKVVAGVIKHCQNILTDNRSQELYSLLQADRSSDIRGVKQQIAYRMEVEKVLVPEENMFKIDWVRSTWSLSFIQSADPTNTVIKLQTPSNPLAIKGGCHERRSTDCRAEMGGIHRQLFLGECPRPISIAEVT